LCPSPDGVGLTDSFVNAEHWVFLSDFGVHNSSDLPTLGCMTTYRDGLQWTVKDLNPNQL